MSLLLSAACASVSAITTQYVGAPTYPPTDPNKVPILRAEPNRSHVRLGEVVVDATIDPAPPMAEIEKTLRVDAAKLGSDAVVVVLDRVQPTDAYVAGPYWSSTVQSINGRKVIGIGIKYLPE